MFIHETIYTINVRKIKMESFFFHRYDICWLKNLHMLDAREDGM